MGRKNHKAVGMIETKFNKCPDALFNCVCSQYPEDRIHFLKPWSYKSEREHTFSLLEKTLLEIKGIEIVLKEGDYMHAQARVPLFGFIDDLEFYLPAHSKEVHFRSASQMGIWDLNLNKMRINKIKRRLQKLGLELF